MDIKLLRMRAEGYTLRQLVPTFGLSVVSISRRLKALEERGITRIPAVNGDESEDYLEVAAPPAPPSQLAAQQRHMREIQAKRRGAEVPPELEKSYFDLLKQGIPIVEALKRLGLSPSQPKRQ